VGYVQGRKSRKEGGEKPRTEVKEGRKEVKEGRQGRKEVQEDSQRKEVRKSRKEGSRDGSSRKNAKDLCTHIYVYLYEYTI
jgi:hypothetical protein